MRVPGVAPAAAAAAEADDMYKESGARPKQERLSRGRLGKRVGRGGGEGEVGARETPR